MNTKLNNNLTYFKKKFKKLEKNIILKNLKSSLFQKHDIMVFAVFNFYNSINISIFKDILEQNNIKYYFVKSNDYKFFIKSNIIQNFWNFLTTHKNISLATILKSFILNKEFNYKSNFINLLNIWNSSLNKNFNIILLLNYKNINNNVLETLKTYAKVDPLYLKFKTHKKLISYNYLVNNLLIKNKSLNNFKPSICNLMFQNQITILRIIKIKSTF